MISLVALRRYVKAPAGEDNDALLQQMERAAVAQVSAHTGRYLGEPAPREEVIRYAAPTEIWLNDAPGSITSVEELAYEGATPTVLAPSSYRLDGARLLRVGADAYWYSDLLYRVTYEAGYAEDEAPEELQLVVLQLVSIMWNQRGSEDVQSETIGGYSYSRTSSAGGGQTAVDAVLARLPRRVRV